MLRGRVIPVAGAVAICTAGFVGADAAAQWTDVTPASMVEAFANSRGGAWGDYDGDDDLDIYVSTWSGANKLFRNDGNDVFADVTVFPLGDTGFGGRPVWGDHDNDGDLDLFVCQSQGNLFLRNDGVAGFVDITGPNPLLMTGYTARGASWGDYDHDGDIDLYVSATAGSDGANKLFRNDGGVLVEATEAPLDDVGVGRGVMWVDYDNDGDLDMSVANGHPGAPKLPDENRLFRNDGAGVFTDVAIGGPMADAKHGRGVAWGDFDNDGDFDLCVANIPSDGETAENRLFRNDGNDVFVDIAAGDLAMNMSTRACAWVDYDNDTDLDLYIGANGPNLLLQNDGVGNFTNVAAGPVADAGNVSGVAWADYDADGDMDGYILNTASGNVLFRNDIVNGNHWIEYRLTGDISNRSAIGARVTLVSGGVTQIREVRSGSGYLVQHMLTVHFGLGTATTVDSVTIQWPSGIKNVILNPAIDMLHDYTEECASCVDCPDCNSNSIADVCDIDDGTSFDCNANFIPDECDTALGSSDDCNGDDVPDECQTINFTGVLSDNTTGIANSLFVGPPDDLGASIGGQFVTYDFGNTRIVDGPGPDLTLYERDAGGAEFHKIDVLIGVDGINFRSIEASESPAVSIPGDEAHSNALLARSYDLAGVGLVAQYIRIDGDGNDPGGGNGFDLDGMGAINVSPASCHIPGDATGDLIVDVGDLLAVLAAWGPCAACPEDINGDGAVDVEDLLLVLANWTIGS